MKKDRMLRGLVSLQAVCMIVVAIVVTTHYVPFLNKPKPAEGGTGGADELSREEGKVLAIIGGKPITEQDLTKELHRQYGASMLRTMMLHEAVKLEAAAQGLTVTAEQLSAELARTMEGYGSEAEYYEEMQEQLGLSREDVQADAEYRLLLEQIATRAITVTDDQIDEYLAEHASEFTGVTELKLRWILTGTRSDANDVIEKLSDGEDFALMAKTYSIDAFTSEQGGDLGYIEDNDPLVEAALLDATHSLDVGQVTGPVKTEGGYAIIRLDERREREGMALGQRREEARRQVSLEQARPLPEVEDELLRKYGEDKRNPAAP
ncbi:PpiC-type peptidyl-prolyl cis-trans isomerase [Paenibacillus curdlanolyticus YK9]|uniref:peptidylprolyl isomerase n=1 Tax=Paenibacillus curdlanolyticus YK9 TaxID=717606 RepID=E0I8Y0_9BACL|nr:peptidylprolyl isomerase [Paenibacillus curdlanolyticus]EFM10864.1 PpiC-type peptidyl-prolyl cis-trans isomerase [Paenibacillus curdlanolyticus YK9]